MHPLNVSHLVIGLVLLGVSGLWTADQAGWITDSTYVLPVLLVGAGVIGLLAFALRGVGSRRTEPIDTPETEVHP
ncbi:hypothetical protein [Nocardioides sp.]|uniref:hypothetical protein n=1 Tax=Nocardioides sp. TaxID=35761 RepID=UPI003D140FFC